MAAFWVINRQLQMFIDSQFTLDYNSQMTDKYFAEYTRIEVIHFRETLLQHMGNVKKSVAETTSHKRLYDKRPVYDKEPMAEIQLTAECNVTAIGQQHTEKPEIINEGRVDQYTEQCQVKSRMLDSSLDNKTTEIFTISETENIVKKRPGAQVQKIFQNRSTLSCS
ncbi:hypothetical protein Tco_0067459 [Tanacetum coccineum]